MPNLLAIMDKTKLISILGDWNFWKQEQFTGQKRSDYLEKLKRFSGTNNVVVVTGARRSGKSVLMKQYAKTLIEEGTAASNVLIANFEDPRFAELNVGLLQQVYETYLEFLNPKKTPLIVLDEIQEVHGWEKWVRTMHELGKAKIIVSGSNAKLLGRELATLLTGRHLDITIFPLSFKEYLLFKGVTLKDELDIIAKKVELDRLLREYAEKGGFPEIALDKETTEKLLHYFDDIINKDLIRRFAIRKPEKIRALARYYLTNIAALSTFTSLEKSLGVSADTIEKFTKYLEDSYMVFSLKRFSFKVKEQEKSPRKIYAIDTGLANAIGFRFSSNTGKLFENIVFLELKRRQSENRGLELYYWKDAQHREVDFVIKNGVRIDELIQVCHDIGNQKTKERETKALLKAMKELKQAEGTVLTEDYDGDERIEKYKIKFISLKKWLLHPQ